MANRYIDINTISDLHQLLHLSPPKHPLVSLLEHDTASAPPFTNGAFLRAGFYTIACKTVLGNMKYGRGSYDFNNGTLICLAPGQVVTPGEGFSIERGWSLFFHPDLLHGTETGKKMHTFSFFNYEVNEALHVSEDEEKTLKDCADKIRKEYSQNIDKHTQGLIVSNLSLLLDYFNRYYDRQFYTRSGVNKDLVQRFERLLKDYFKRLDATDLGLPTVGYFAARLNLSPHYLSDLLQKYTGKTTQEYIHLEIVNNARSLLLGTENSISEIAFRLGFEHASHFTRLFKTKTGKSPSEFRRLN
ncbi:helix-turn-helix domain-containing protein [Chitinophaga silvisoli]|uniref:AraC family transcriptional regulator n=1 Tax=Chitinophaga silvisoli TaxID=2291814 RepID=A0A3E1NYP9_9BACT|nr:helix-turn-helix domain-containing protein [Chitinophaga silvisoli]RFM33066.1 AraC family transcriptional regulator [Chitinophaga silvisoli]